MENWLDLNQRRVAITGGGSGIGLAVTRAFLGAGARVEIIDRNPSTQDVAASLDAGPARGRVRAHLADVRDRTSMQRVADSIARDGGGVDILVPNAGVNVRAALLDLTDADIDTIVSTNLVGVIVTMQVFVPLMKGSDAASIVVTSSAIAEHGMVLRSVYAATKAGVSGLVRSAALEWGPTGIRVNAVAPGVIATPLTQAYMDQFPERADAARTGVPLGRIGTPEDVADVVLALAGRPSRFITGQTVYVDGGLTAGTTWW